jgi:hypothetical protein
MLWNLKIHYHVQNRPPLGPILSEISSVHASPWSYLFKINSTSNIILSSTQRCSKWSLSTQVSPPKRCILLSSPHTRYMHRTSHYFSFDHLNSILRGEQIMQLLCMLSPPIPSYLVHLSPKEFYNLVRTGRKLQSKRAKGFICQLTFFKLFSITSDDVNLVLYGLHFCFNSYLIIVYRLRKC